MEMEYGRAITYPQQDPDWLKKWGLAGAISLIPLLGQIIVLGYGVEVTRRVIHDDPRPLPGWGDFANFAIQGLMAFIIGLVYVLPLIVLIVCANSVQIGLLIGGAQLDEDLLAQLTTLGSAVAVCCGCLAALYGVLIAMMLPAALGRYAATGQIGSAFQINQVVGMVRAKPGMYFFVWLVGGLAGLALTLIGTLACGVGLAWGAAYAALINAHLHGQAYRYVTSPPA